MKFKCRCGQGLECDEELAGMVVDCPACGGKVRAPGDADVCTPEEETPTTPEPQSNIVRQAPADEQKVCVVGVRIPFADLVLLLVQLAIASIPATIILACIWSVVMFVISAMVGW